MKSNTVQDSLEGFESRENSIDELKHEYENLLRQFLFLNERVSMLFSWMNADEMLKKIAGGIHRMLDVDRVGILSINTEEKMLECKHAAGLDKDTQENIKISISDCQALLLKTAESKSPFLSLEESAVLKKLI